MSCCEKVSYKTKRKAKASAKAQREQHGKFLYPHRCKQCGKWHLHSGTRSYLPRTRRRAVS
jgi:cytochrome c5